MPAIQLKNVFKNYGTATNAVDGISLTIDDGDFMCLLGPSGCGKTTTLRMIAGLEHPTGGSITVGGRVVDDVEAGKSVPAEMREMGLVFQSYALWPHLSVADNIGYGLKLRGVEKEQRVRRGDEVMKTMGILPYRARYPSELSGGQQQRVALARMLAVSPQVMLLDEPLSNLDSRLRLEMRAELKRIHKEFQSTIVFVTHDQWEAMTLATRVAVMKDGVLQQLGTPMDIYDRPVNRFVAEFLGVPPICIFEIGDPDARRRAVNDLVAAFVAPRLRNGAALGSVGIRPEAFIIGSAGDAVDGSSLVLRGRLDAVMPTGGSWTTDTVVDGMHIYSTSTARGSWSPGEEISLRVDPSDIHAFDADGRRLDLQV